MRQAFAGMLWSKQYYGYNVARWLDGDPGLPPPPAERLTARNATWRHFDAADIISMPDPWEYPWFAAWDLAFHAVTFAHIDPAFAKYQLLLLCREWFQHPNGALPAYEWSFDDVNPPVHAAAAYLVWTIDGRKDDEFLQADLPQAAAQLHVVAEPPGQGGQRPLLGRLPRPRQHRRLRPVAPARRDGARAVRCHGLDVHVLPEHAPDRDRPRGDGSRLRGLPDDFLEHAVRIAAAMNRSGLWDEEDGFFYDALKLADGSAVPIKVHSMVGLIPLLPVASIPAGIGRRGQSLGKRFAEFMEDPSSSGERLREGGFITGRPGHENLQLSVVPPVRLGKLLGEMLSEDGFLSPHGLRALSQRHRDSRSSSSSAA